MRTDSINQKCKVLQGETAAFSRANSGCCFTLRGGAITTALPSLSLLLLLLQHVHAPIAAAASRCAPAPPPTPSPSLLLLPSGASAASQLLLPSSEVLTRRW